MSKNLIIFMDSGDTLIDEGSQVYDGNGIVTGADFIPGAQQMLTSLCDEGFRIALVADGEWESFQNVYPGNGCGDCFEQWIVSEVVGHQKPHVSMFDTAMEKMGLREEDKPYIVMVGNNLKKDIAGANRYGITSVWMDWSPRYFHTVEEADWQPDYTVRTPQELYGLIHKLEKELEESSLTSRKLARVTEAFTRILYEEDETFLKNMQDHNLAGDDIEKYRYWEWTQGVGLFGLWKLFCHEREGAHLQHAEKYLSILRDYYDRQLLIGFPALNVNTAAPYLAMSFLAEYTGEEKYMEPCRKAAKEIMETFPRTTEGGFQHKTSDSLNEQELWDDTLYMAVLFLANMGRILKDGHMVQEAEYQFLLHEKYLCDPVTGLWYHGFTFAGRNHFAGAFWGRGNCWITMAIPEFLSIIPKDGAIRRRMIQVLNRQVESLAEYQAPNGMWHTLLDDADSYVEASATCGFAYGILKAVKDGLIDPSYRKVALKALPAVLNCISEEGVVHQVSYGTPMGRTDKNFYKEIELKPMPYGQALAMLFLTAV
ncbi:MAG: glycoside hydrolase family 88 protein [Lachnospiraceae bacterium]|nr:glycoside hydrolase family 88 protein [Lachnospiraceae bacterium]